MADPAAKVTHRVSPADTVSQTMTMAWRATKKMRRNPEQFFDVVFQPLLFTAMFAYIFGGAVCGQRADYLPLLIPGILAQTTLTACIATGIQLREDMDKGVFDRFKSLPIARIAPLAGPMVADLLRYTIATVLTFATGIVMGYRPGGGVFGVVTATLLVIVTGWSLAWIFTFVGIIGSSAQSVQGISMMIMFPLTFLSNAFVPRTPCPTGCRSSCRSTRSRTWSPPSATSPTRAPSPPQVGWALLACVAVVAVFAPLSVQGLPQGDVIPRLCSGGAPAPPEPRLSRCGHGVQRLATQVDRRCPAYSSTSRSSTSGHHGVHDRCARWPTPTWAACGGSRSAGPAPPAGRPRRPAPVGLARRAASSRRPAAPRPATG